MVMRIVRGHRHGHVHRFNWIRHVNWSITVTRGINVLCVIRSDGGN